MQDFALVARGKFRTLSRDSLAARGNKPTQVIFADLVGKLPIQLVPMARVPPGEVADVTQDWVVKALWDPAKDGSDMERCASRIVELFGSVPVTYVFPFKWMSADSAQALHRG